MKIYVSLPITGHNINRCKERANGCRRALEGMGHSVITPFDVCPEADKPYAFYMGRDIEALMGCDAIFLTTGWCESRGCQLEWRCAEIYHKKIFQHMNEVARTK